MNEPVMIKRIRRESSDVVSLFFDWDAEAAPGQFVMVCIPGLDEVPMSLSTIGPEKSISIKAIGETTRFLHTMGEGDRISVRGPYGRGFRPDGRILIVGGGVGMAAMMPLLRSTGADLIIGARKEDELVFLSECREYTKNVWVSTDDGSVGFHGNAVQLMNQVLDEGSYDMVAACGPEVMLYYLHQACMERGLECQLSLERFMKCGVGLCGSCVVDGQRVCAEGPVFDSATLEKLKEFGKFKRDVAGRRVRL
ncbi:MAG: dihydroorotate dehydrogenase electron transfer subunit [Candidatus Methanomethylophilaceae archaeon]|nr:dihydroorotate dehydrogenase electron transfer subunit [Candidatus Methanomethylophilaceae archaeon]